VKTDRYRLERILEIGSQLQDVVNRREITAEDVENNLETQWLITTPLFNIGEQANCLSEAFVSAHPEAPWAQIACLRHRLVHNYEGTNWSIISTVLLEEIPAFTDQVRAILDSISEEEAGS